MTSQKLYDLILVTTGDEDKAERARADFMMAQMKAGEEV